MLCTRLGRPFPVARRTILDHPGRRRAPEAHRVSSLRHAARGVVVITANAHANVDGVAVLGPPELLHRHGLGKSRAARFAARVGTALRGRRAIAQRPPANRRLLHLDAQPLGRDRVARTRVLGRLPPVRARPAPKASASLAGRHRVPESPVSRRRAIRHARRPRHARDEECVPLGVDPLGCTRELAFAETRRSVGRTRKRRAEVLGPRAINMRASSEFGSSSRGHPRFFMGSRPVKISARTEPRL